MKYRNKKSGATREGTPECYHTTMIHPPTTMSSTTVNNVKMRNFKFLIIIFNFSLLIFNFGIKDAEAALILQAPKYIGLNNGLVGYWSFDGKDMAGNIAYDRSGQGNNGTLTNGPVRAIGKLGQALSFDGSNDYVSAPNPSTSQILSYSFWFNSTNISANSYILDRGGNNNWIELGSSKIVFGSSPSSLFTSNTVFSSNTWYHIVAIFDGATRFLYVNGALDKSAIGGGATPTALDIGRYSANNFFFPGLIDDVRVYNRALSADEIKRLYRIGATLKVNTQINNDSLARGLVGYWSLNAPDIAGTTIYDRSGNAKNGSALGQDISHSGLVGWWKMDEGSGTSAGDSSGSGNTGTLAASPATPTWTTSSKIGANALSFDGTNDYISTTGDFIGTGADSVAAWIYAVNYGEGGFGRIVDNDYFFFHVQSATLTVSSNAGATVVSAAAGAIQLTTWYHVVVTRNSSGTVNFYVNGRLSGTADQASGTPINGNEVIIGNRSFNDRTFNGSIDDVRVYNRALSATEVAQLYAYGLPKHAPAVGKIGQGIDSTQSYVNPGNVNSSVNSFAFWLKTASSSPTINLMDLNASQNIKVVAGTVTASGITSPSVFVDGASASTVNAGWHHIAVTTGTAVNASAVDIGLNATTTAPLDGALDDVRFYNRVINTDEIKRLYKIGATLKINSSLNTGSLNTGLVGYWSFDGKDMAGNTAYDRSGNANNGTLTNGPTRAIGKLGQALSFDGVNQYVNFGTFDIVQPITVCGWYKPDDFGDTGVLFVKRTTSGSTNLRFQVYHALTTGAIRAYTGTDDISLNGSLTAGVWQHVCVVLTSSNSVLYLNGVAQTAAAALTFGTKADSMVSIGMTLISGSPDDVYDGLIDDVRVYNRALSADEIQRLYNLGR